jgi:hypothetical protein
MISGAGVQLRNAVGIHLIEGTGREIIRLDGFNTGTLRPDNDIVLEIRRSSRNSSIIAGAIVQ